MRFVGVRLSGIAGLLNILQYPLDRRGSLLLTDEARDDGNDLSLR